MSAAGFQERLLLTALPALLQVYAMMVSICGRFRLELDPSMGGEAGVLERQISAFALAVDGGLFLRFHDRSVVGPAYWQEAALLRALLAAPLLASAIVLLLTGSRFPPCPTVQNLTMMCCGEFTQETLENQIV